MQQFETNSFEETQKIGFDLAQTLRGGEVLALYGDLGAGKTTFMQGLAKGLGIDRTIISPTFIIMRSYIVDSKNASAVRNLYHLDLYRIETEAEAIDIGLMDLVSDAQNVVAIEWPDKVENMLPENSVNIYFEYVGDEKRRIRIERN